jgi:HK97 family phage major capsid protein
VDQIFGTFRLKTARPPILDAVQFLQTLSIADVASPQSSNVYLGDFAECMIGIRTELNIRILNERYAESGEVGVYGWMRADVAFRHNASFVIASVSGF